MKIRTGFVSNSSTSSFVIFARRASIDEIDDPNVKIMIAGDDGTEYGHPTEEMIELIRHYASEVSFDLYYEFFSVIEEIEIESKKFLAKIAHFVLNPPKEKIIIKTFKISHYFPKSIEDFANSVGINT